MASNSVQRVGVSIDDSSMRETALNGDYPESTATIDLSDTSNTGLPRMEDMLRVATDLQDNSSLHDSNNSDYRGIYKYWNKRSVLRR